MLFKNGREISVLFVFLQISPCCIVLKSKFKRIFSLKRGNKGKYANKQNNTIWNKVYCKLILRDGRGRKTTVSMNVITLFFFAESFSSLFKICSFNNVI